MNFDSLNRKEADRLRCNGIEDTDSAHCCVSVVDGTDRLLGKERDHNAITLCPIKSASFSLIIK
jgi:hypothetical protein